MMFSSVWHTDLAKEIGIEKLYFNLDKQIPEILKFVAIVRKNDKYEGIVFIFNEYSKREYEHWVLVMLIGVVYLIKKVMK